MGLFICASAAVNVFCLLFQSAALFDSCFGAFGDRCSLERMCFSSFQFFAVPPFHSLENLVYPFVCIVMLFLCYLNMIDFEMFICVVSP